MIDQTGLKTFDHTAKCAICGKIISRNREIFVCGPRRAGHNSDAAVARLIMSLINTWADVCSALSGLGI